MRRCLWAWAEALLVTAIVLAIANAGSMIDTLIGRPSPDGNLIFAASCRDRASFDAALSAGASIAARDQQGNTALAVAALHGDAAMVARLLALGADVNSSDVRGFTPLMYAAIHDHSAVAQMLLDHGADPTRATHATGLRALDLAKQNQSPHVTALLARIESRQTGQ
jgi:ankyrin repeat protein